jgi:hypothetical protein
VLPFNCPGSTGLGSRLARSPPRSRQSSTIRYMQTSTSLSYDEKPGIQAIATTAPDRPPLPGKSPTVMRDHQYKRHGTLTLSRAGLLGQFWVARQPSICLPVQRFDTERSDQWPQRGHPGAQCDADVRAKSYISIPKAGADFTDRGRHERRRHRHARRGVGLCVSRVFAHAVSPLTEPVMQLPDGRGGDSGSVRRICAGRPVLKEVIAKLMLEDRLLGQARSRFRIQCVADGARQGR